MAVKFENMQFTIKDVCMIVGATIWFFSFSGKIDSRFDEFELRFQKIISDGELNKFELNAKIESLKHAGNSKSKKLPELKYMALIPINRFELKRKKLFEFKLT